MMQHLSGFQQAWEKLEAVKRRLSDDQREEFEAQSEVRSSHSALDELVANYL